MPPRGQIHQNHKVEVVDFGENKRREIPMSRRGPRQTHAESRQSRVQVPESDVSGCVLFVWWQASIRFRLVTSRSGTTGGINLTDAITQTAASSCDTLRPVDTFDYRIRKILARLARLHSSSTDLDQFFISHNFFKAYVQV